MDIQENLLQLAFVGDVALGNHPKSPGFGFYSLYKNGIPKSIANRILPAGISPDIFFGNLEFALANNVNHVVDDLCCLGSTLYISFLRQAGFTVLNIANNHAWDYGPGVFWGTVKMLQTAEFKVVGIPEDFDPNSFLQIKNRRVAILGCSARPPRPGFTEPPSYNQFEKEKFLDKILMARKQSDLVCVSIHWGEEFLTIPSPDERAIAHAMIEAGAGVVVGHHPHALREVENYRDGIIAYSLGNFICDMTWNPLTRESGCLVLETDNSRSFTSMFFPAIIDDDYFPRYLDQIKRTHFFKDQLKHQAQMKMALEKVDYNFLAKKALTKHQWLTVSFLLKNIFRYKVSTLIRIIFQGIRSRLQWQNS